MTPFLRTFDCALARARDRLHYARRELDRAERNHDAGDPRAARSLRKLQDDVEKAQRDVGWAEYRFKEAASVDAASLAFRREAAE
jgi:hypothetical protein